MSIHIIYDDESLSEYFEHQEVNLLDGRTPMFALAVPDFKAVAVHDEPFTLEEALEAADEEDEDSEQDEDDFEEGA